jgi:hypothetical protein
MKNQTIVILTGVTDDQYRSKRNDNPVISTSAGKRILLYRAIASAAGKPLLLLSPHPRGHGKPSSLPEMESRFDRFAQRFSRASGIRKVRIFLDILHYAAHAYRNTKNDDLLLIDNYELIYVLALYYCRLRGRRNPIILEYEDGKHLVDKGVYLWMSRLAEILAKPMVNAAIVAAPGLIEHLPDGIPFEIVPGIIKEGVVMHHLPKDDSPIHFIYSGSLDSVRGVPLLLEYLESGGICENAVFHVTGQGHFVERLQRLAERWPTKIIFHGCVSREEVYQIQLSCHYGLNLQTSSDPISNVTFPSKTFDYVNAGLGLVSTRSAGVEKVFGDFPVYLNEESVHSLSESIQVACSGSYNLQGNLPLEFMSEKTKERLIVFFKALSR